MGRKVPCATREKKRRERKKSPYRSRNKGRPRRQIPKEHTSQVNAGQQHLLERRAAKQANRDAREQERRTKYAQALRELYGQMTPKEQNLFVRRSTVPLGLFDKRTIRERGPDKVTQEWNNWTMRYREVRIPTYTERTILERPEVARHYSEGRPLPQKAITILEEAGLITDDLH